AGLPEEAAPAAEEHRRHVDVELVEEAGLQVLLHDRRAAAEQDVPVSGGCTRLLERALDPVGDQRERRPALLDDRFALMVSEHEDRHVERRVVAPPGIRIRIARPRPFAAAEHLAAHDSRTDAGPGLAAEVVGRAGLAPLAPLPPAPARGAETPSRASSRRLSRAAPQA